MQCNSQSSSQSRQPWYIHRNFALLWIGQAISNLGDFTFDTTLILWIGATLARGQSWGPLAVSGVLVSTAIPTLLLGPIAGVFADRWDRRRILLIMDIIRAILIGSLALLSSSMSFLPLSLQQMPITWQLLTIYGIVFLASSCAQFFNPARFALGGEIVDEPQRARASGLGQLTTNIALLIGPALGAFLFFTVSVQWAFFLNAFSFVVSFVSIRFLQLPHSPITGDSSSRKPHQFASEFVDGLQIFFKSRVLQTILLSMVLVLFSGGATDSLGLFFVIHNLHANASFYGLLGSVSGAALLIGAALASYGVQRIGMTHAFWLGMLLMGILEILYSRATNSLFALLLVFFQGFPNAFLNTAMGPLVMKVTPRTHTGRVLALFIPTMTLARIISAFFAAQLVSTLFSTFHVVLLGISFGPFDTVLLCVGLIVVIGGVYAMIKLRT